MSQAFLGLEVEQGKDGISLHLDTYIQELVEDNEEYRLIHRKFIKPKTVPMSPFNGVGKQTCAKYWGGIAGS